MKEKLYKVYCTECKKSGEIPASSLNDLQAKLQSRTLCHLGQHQVKYSLLESYRIIGVKDEI